MKTIKKIVLRIADFYSDFSASIYFLYVFGGAALLGSLGFALHTKIKVENRQVIEITDDMVHWSSDQFRIMPEMTDTVTYIIQGSINDNEVILMDVADSSYISMIVESAYIEQYLSGVQISLVRSR